MTLVCLACTSTSLSEEGIESFGLKYVLVGGHRGVGGPVQRQGCQLLLGQESHCGGASDTSERPELYWGGGTVCAVLVHSPYRSVSRADGWGQSGLGQGHIHGCPQGVTIYEKCGFAFTYVALRLRLLQRTGHPVSVGMICLLEVGCGITCAAQPLGGNICGVFPLT